MNDTSINKSNLFMVVQFKELLFQPTILISISYFQSLTEIDANKKCFFYSWQIAISAQYILCWQSLYLALKTKFYSIHSHRYLSPRHSKMKKPCSKGNYFPKDVSQLSSLNALHFRLWFDSFFISNSNVFFVLICLHCHINCMYAEHIFLWEWNRIQPLRPVSDWL